MTEEENEGTPKTDAEQAEKSNDENTEMHPTHAADPEDDHEMPGVDPGNSPPAIWTEDLTADELDEVVKLLEEHVANESATKDGE